MTATIRAMGLMSGTSMDGIDAAVIETDGEAHIVRSEMLSVAYDDGMRRLLWSAIERAARFTRRDEARRDLADVTRRITDRHAEVVAQLGERLQPPVDLIGFHGQTVLHRPEIGLTIQLGDGARLAQLCRCDVIDDFRANDMAHGGHGAPFAPAYHMALAAAVAQRPVAFLNLGGVANLTFIDDGDPIAFDTGPANGMIDQWVERHTGETMDEGGRIAGSGRVDDAVLARLLDDPFFEAPPPKSLDRFDFSSAPVAGLTLEDGAATLTAFTASALLRAVEHLPRAPAVWVACGGGRHNAALMAALAETLPGTVQTAEDIGWRGDIIEAEAFAYLAVRSLKGLPLSFPSTTGVSHPVSGGVLHKAAAD